MSKNYTSYSKGTPVNTVNQKPELFGHNTTPEVTEPTVEDVKEEVTSETPKVKIIKGVVANCKRLNVRQQPSPTAPVVKIINEGTVLEIDEEKSTINFYKVSGKGFDGYCMKQFITLQ